MKARRTLDQSLNIVIRSLRKAGEATAAEVAGSTGMSIKNARNLLGMLKKEECVELTKGKPPKWKFLQMRNEKQLQTKRQQRRDAVIASMERAAKKEQGALEASKFAADTMVAATKRAFLRSSYR